MSIFQDSEAVPITEAGRRGVSRLVTDAEAGHFTVLQRRSEPIAAVVGYRDVERLLELVRDLTDLALVLARAASDSGRRTSLDAVIEAAGYTRAELEAMDDPA